MIVGRRNEGERNEKIIALDEWRKVGRHAGNRKTRLRS